MIAPTLIASNYIPDPHAEVGHCVHRIAMDPAKPDVLFMQKHWDVIRTDNAGELWTEVSGNLPSDFGFVVDVHAHEPNTVYVIPIKSDSEQEMNEVYAEFFSANAPARSTIHGQRWPEGNLIGMDVIATTK